MGFIHKPKYLLMNALKKFNLNIKRKNGKINIYLYIHFERGAFMNIAIITGASSGIGREFAIQLNKKKSLMKFG